MKLNEDVLMKFERKNKNKRIVIYNLILWELFTLINQLHFTIFILKHTQWMSKQLNLI